jgi:16S rRNA C967 or C1407 C5-methylase (RsmB/RsmF family)
VAAHPDDARELAALQRRLLDAAAEQVAIGGRLTYAVCTWTAAETDAITSWFDAAHGSRFEPLERVQQLFPDVDGHRWDVRHELATA